MELLGLESLAGSASVAALENGRCDIGGFGAGFRLGRLGGWRRTAVSPEVLAIIACFVAVDEFERARIVAEGAKGEGCNGGVVGGRWGSFGPTAYFVFHARLFHAPDAQLTPARYGHVFD
ncbi:MAG TPA: hypothetical protein VK789_20490 [Bryobacteraceae bacterium]|nr:hypothetical protein [Bryobacteraceae bacterium]